MLLHWIWLDTRPNLSELNKLELLQQFPDPEALFYADKAALESLEFLSEEGRAALLDKKTDQAFAILNACAKHHIQILTLGDAAYPKRLKNIPDPPPVLYYKGRLPELDSIPVVAVVGTRHATAYGINTAKRMGAQITKCGGTVVSGMALGVDAAAISGALSAGGSPVGVLGCGVDIVYPLCNRSVFADTERCGCLLPEFPPGTPPLKWNFPKRNRIISGLSNGVLIVEAPAKSGALITARQAAEQGRDVFAVPGNIDMASCVGTNALLREGAIAVSSGWDVISEYSSLYPGQIRRWDPTLPMDSAASGETPEPVAKVAQQAKTPAPKGPPPEKKEKITIDKGEMPPYSDIQDRFRNLSQTEQAVLACIADSPMLVDDLLTASQLPAGTVLSTLTLLELKGVVQRAPGKRVSLVKTE